MKSSWALEAQDQPLATRKQGVELQRHSAFLQKGDIAEKHSTVETVVRVERVAIQKYPVQMVEMAKPEQSMEQKEELGREQQHENLEMKTHKFTQPEDTSAPKTV